MKRSIFAIVTILVIVLWPFKAQADDENSVPMRVAAPADICVASDFPLTGSGYRPKAAIRNWNSALTAAGLPIALRFTSQSTALQCEANIILHRYNSADLPEDHFAKGWCGYTAYDRNNELNAWVPTDTLWTYKYADISFNDACMTPKRVIDGVTYPASAYYTKRGNKYMIAHELGHALGLPHNETGSTTAVMSYAYDYHTYRGAIGAEDIAALTAIYSVPLVTS